MRALLLIAILLLTVILPSKGLYEHGIAAQIASAAETPEQTSDGNDDGGALNAASACDVDSPYLGINNPLLPQLRHNGSRQTLAQSTAPESRQPARDPFPPRAAPTA